MDRAVIFGVSDAWATIHVPFILHSFHFISLLGYGNGFMAWEGTECINRDREATTKVVAKEHMTWFEENVCKTTAIEREREIERERAKERKKERKRKEKKRKHYSNAEDSKTAKQKNKQKESKREREKERKRANDLDAK